MRLAVYTDYQYRGDGAAVYADKAFALFLAELAGHVDRLVLCGRLRPETGPGHYRLPPTLDFVGLPHYATLARPAAAVPAMARSLRRLWRTLDEVEVVWVLGPHLLGLALVALATLRRRRVVLGVRQDLPRYVRARHPGRPALALAALGLEAAWRVLALTRPVVTVGPDLAHRYRGARRRLALAVSLVRARTIDPASAAARRSYAGELRILSVGRLEREKAPHLLLDALARLERGDHRWRLVICGEGPLRDELAARSVELGLDGRVELRGYLPVDGGLLELYRDSHVFLHVSLTEGLPQVLFEAFAARLPVVATAVGGVPEAAAGCALLVPPGDPAAAAAAVARLAADPGLRDELTEAGARRVAHHTLEAETARLARFLRDGHV